MPEPAAQPPAPAIHVFLALGSNQGDRQAALAAAARHLAGCLHVERLSSLYETEPAYVSDQPRFLNMALAGTTTLTPHALLGCLKAIEREMGRVGGIRWGARPIDLDILVYGELQLETPELTIPHARMTERRFVLEPLSEIAADFVIPGTDKTVQELARNAPNIGDVIARRGPLT